MDFTVYLNDLRKVVCEPLFSIHKFLKNSTVWNGKTGGIRKYCIDFFWGGEKSEKGPIGASILLRLTKERK